MHLLDPSPVPGASAGMTLTAVAWPSREAITARDKKAMMLRVESIAAVFSLLWFVDAVGKRGVDDGRDTRVLRVLKGRYIPVYIHERTYSHSYEENTIQY